MITKAAVLIISDRCSVGKAVDKSGPTISKCLNDNQCVDSVLPVIVIPDEKSLIELNLIKLCDEEKVDLVITSGGTGFTGRDVTPEATNAVLHKQAPGITIALLTGSLKVTPMAMLSRLTAGIRNSTLIVNMPGSAKACAECLGIILPVLKHALDQLRENRERIDAVHSQINEKTRSKVVSLPPALRPRQSTYPMIQINDAFEMIFKETTIEHSIETVNINDYGNCLGRILARHIVANVPLPPFPASMKDGYAVVASDGQGPRKLFSSVSVAGSDVNDVFVTPGFCIRVSTGAAVPRGADAVVQVEDTKVLKQTSDGEEEIIEITSPVTVGQDIRPVGCDIKKDETILYHLSELGPIELGLLATVGVNNIEVYKQPTVAVLSTGDEIFEPGDSLPATGIWDSNRTTLLSYLKSNNIKSLDLGIARDQVDDIYAKLCHGLDNADVIITTGGVSMGEKDLLKQILHIDFDAQVHFGRVNLKPGKPTTFATCVRKGQKKFIFALPGNPVSAFVTCHLFVLPALRILEGRYQLANHSRDIFSYHKTTSVRLDLGDKASKSLDPRHELVRAVIQYGDDFPIARLTGNQRSSRLMSVKDANALLLFPGRSDTCKTIENGTKIQAILL